MSTILSEEDVMKAAASVKAEPKKMDEIDVLFPANKVFVVNGESIHIREFTFGELPKAINLVKGVGALFAHYNGLQLLNSVEAIMHIVGEGGEDLIELLAFNVKKPRAWFDTIPADVGVDMLMTFLHSNVSFFTNRVAPILMGTPSK